MKEPLILTILSKYETISIQTMQITINDLDKDKIEFITPSILKLTVNSKEDVFIKTRDIKAIYGKNRRE